MWIFTLWNYMKYLKIVTVRSIVVIKVMLSKPYRVAWKLRRHGWNVLNSYNVYIHYNYPFESVLQFTTMLTDHRFEMNRGNYEVYDKLISKSLETTSSRRFFRISDNVNEMEMNRHEDVFNNFLEQYMLGSIKTALYNLDHREQHIYTEPLRIMGEILIRFDRHNRKVRFGLFKSELRDRLAF